MTVDAIKSAAQGAGKIALEGSIKAFESVGSFLKGSAKKIAEWANIFFNNLPYYYQIAKDYTKLGMEYSKLGINYIRENKNPVIVGTGIGIATTFLACGIIKFLHRADEI